jgi:hypothetical protein
MPVVNLTLSGIGESFTRPMIYDLIKQVQQIVKIPDTAQIFFPSGIDVNPTAKTNIDEINDRKARFSADRYLYIEVEEAYDVDELGSMAVNHQENVVVFLDEEANVAVWPIYMKTDYTINFRYQTVSKSEADRWMADMRMRTTQMRDTPLHSIDYHYPVPEPILELLGTIHTHKLRLDGAPVDFDEYLKRFSSPRLKKISDQTGKNTKYAISERQSRIVGLFNTTPLPEKVERDGESAGWLCTFSYKVSVMRPEGIGCRYPIMVYNRLLDDRYIAFRRPQSNPDRQANSTQTLSMSAMSMFESDKQLTNSLNIYLPYQIPDYDEFILKKGPAGYGIGLSILVEVDETTPQNRTLFNLMEIDPYEIDTDILDFIINTEWMHMGRAYMSIVHVALCENYKHMGNRFLEVDSNLDVKSVIDLDPKKIYHVVLSICVDLTYLHKDAIERIRKHPAAFTKLVTLVNEGLRDNPDLSVIAKKPQVSKLDFERFFRFYLPGNPKGLNGTNAYRTPPDNEDLITLRHSRKTMPFIQGPHRNIPDSFVRGDFYGFNTLQLSSLLVLRRNDIAKP